MKNVRLLVAYAARQFLLFPIPIITLFWKDQIGMSLADIMVLQAIFGLAVVLFEFPSGYLADRLGYRRSILVGTTFLLAGWLLYTRAATFWVVALAETILGAGSAFVSGADRAILWVSLEGEGRAAQYTRWDGRIRAVSQSSEALSAAAGGWLYATAARLPFWLQVPSAALAWLAATMLREAPRVPVAGGRSHAARAWHIIGFTLWHHRRLRAAMALSIALGLSTFVVIWLIQPYMQQRGFHTAWFGPLWACAHIGLAGVSLSSARVATVLGARQSLLLCCRLSFVVAGPPIGALVDRAATETALSLLAVGLGAMALLAFRAFAAAPVPAGSAGILSGFFTEARAGLL